MEAAFIFYAAGFLRLAFLFAKKCSVFRLEVANMRQFYISELSLHAAAIILSAITFSLISLLLISFLPSFYNFH
jgi:hypothetical protein